MNQALGIWYPDCVLPAGHPEPILSVGLPLPRLSSPLRLKLLYIQAPEHGWEESLDPLLLVSLSLPSASTTQKDVPILWQAGHRSFCPLGSVSANRFGECHGP